MSQQHNPCSSSEKPCQLYRKSLKLKVPRANVCGGPNQAGCGDRSKAHSRNDANIVDPVPSCCLVPGTTMWAIPGIKYLYRISASVDNRILHRFNTSQHHPVSSLTTLNTRYPAYFNLMLMFIVGTLRNQRALACVICLQINTVTELIHRIKGELSRFVGNHVTNPFNVRICPIRCWVSRFQNLVRKPRNAYKLVLQKEATRLSKRMTLVVAGGVITGTKVSSARDAFILRMKRREVSDTARILETEKDSPLSIHSILIHVMIVRHTSWCKPLGL